MTPKPSRAHFRSNIRLSIRWPVLVLAAVVAMLAWAAVGQPRVARASGCCPQIHWDSSMIISGQNGNHPSGPVGEHALIHGVATAGEQIYLLLVQGDSSANAIDVCGSPTRVVQLTDSLTVGQTGTYDFGFLWPSNAGSGVYSVCAYHVGDNVIVGASADGPFTVLSADPPAISVTPSSITAGETITVTGRSWLPAQPVNVFLGDLQDCAGCNPWFHTVKPNGSPLVSQTVNSAADGTFTTQLIVPATASGGTFRVGANTDNTVLALDFTGTSQVSVTAAPPTVAPTVAPTQIPARTPSSGAAPNSTTDALSPVIFVVVGVIALLVLVAAVVLVTRRRRGQFPQGAPITTIEAAVARGNGKVFISHAHDDNARCRPLLAALTSWGVDYWFDEQRMDAGSDLSGSIQRAITERDVFLRICTSAGQRSYWTKLETSAFRGLQAEDSKAANGGRKVMINLILDPAYEREPFDYAFIFIDATRQSQSAAFDALRRALGAGTSQAATITLPAREDGGTSGR